MNRLSIEELHELRLTIFENAESLQHEAMLLLQHGYFARAYLLAHFCCEELGKIPIIVGAIGQMATGNAVDWKKANRRFRNHSAKINSDDTHHYVFALEPDLLFNTDVEWLEKARQTAPERYAMKNDSTYVDVRSGKVLTPMESVSREDADEMVKRAFESLRAHWQSESLTNPGFADFLERAQAESDRSG